VDLRAARVIPFSPVIFCHNSLHYIRLHCLAVWSASLCLSLSEILQWVIIRVIISKKTDCSAKVCPLGWTIPLFFKINYFVCKIACYGIINCFGKDEEMYVRRHQSSVCISIPFAIAICIFSHPVCSITEGGAGKLNPQNDHSFLSLPYTLHSSGQHRVLCRLFDFVLPIQST